MRNVDSAGRRAHEVVGLYGDPDTTWGICVELGLHHSLDQDAATLRLARLIASFPHLGPSPQIVHVGSEGWDRARAEAAGAPYRVGDPLVRVLADDTGRVVVAAHHGVCDGLGLAAIAAATCNLEVTSHARGIGTRAAAFSFARGSLGRLFEALLRPPPRFVSHHEPTEEGETLLVRTGSPVRVGTADLAAAVAAVFGVWNPVSAGSAGRPLLIAGASRREPGALAPDRRTGYLRFRVDPDWDREELRAAFAQIAPEPEFPETSAAGIGPRVTRLLRHRLGGTAQLSNLGVLEAPGLSSMAMFPALSGPRAVAVGLVTTAETTTLSLRTRGSEFSVRDSKEILDRIETALRSTQ